MSTPLTILIVAASVGNLLSIAVGVILAARRTSLSSSQRQFTTTAAVLFLALWLGLALLLASQGFYAGQTGRIPNIAFVFIPLVISYLVLRFSSALRQIAAVTPQHWLIGVQIYRIIGGVFLILFAQQLVPGVFALPAGIGDVIVGITAPIVAYLSFTKHPSARPLAVIWNSFGLADLILAVALGVLSAPSPLQRIAFDIPNTLSGHFPLVLIPSIIVPISILLHLVSFSKVLGSGSKAASTFDQRYAS